MTIASQLLDVKTQLDGCRAANSRPDQTPFERRLTYDRAVDMTIRLADIYLAVHPIRRFATQGSAEAQDRPKAYLRVAGVLALLRSQRVPNLPDLEDIDYGIRERGKSIHQARPTESTPAATAHAHRQASLMFEAVRRALQPDIERE